MVALPGNALLQLITSGTILPVVIYGGRSSCIWRFANGSLPGRARFRSGAGSCRSRSARWFG
jgi:hypothetical protein